MAKDRPPVDLDLDQVRGEAPFGETLRAVSKVSVLGDLGSCALMSKEDASAPFVHGTTSATGAER